MWLATQHLLEEEGRGGKDAILGLVGLARSSHHRTAEARDRGLIEGELDRWRE
jgi:hypothetical protein